MNQLRAKAALLPACFLIAALPSFAASIITMDESGNGSVTVGGVTTTLPSFQSTDTTNSPLVFSNVLTYGPLPSDATAGDVEVFVGGTPGDVIRFNGTANVFFYAGAGIGANDSSLATKYTPPIPPPPVPNTFRVPLTSGDSLSYTPTPGQPGYDATTTPTYDFIFAPSSSGAATPEPASFALGFVGAAALLIVRKLRRV